MDAYLPYVTVVAGAFAALVLALLGRAYWQRRQRLRVRLLTGRRTLWRQEIDACGQQLAALEAGDLCAARPVTEDAVNDIHAALLDRQAHLQNYEDLANLQRQKIATLNYHLQHEDTPSVEPASEAEEDAESQGEHRERVQAELLARIGAVQNDPQPPGAEGT